MQKPFLIAACLSIVSTVAIAQDREPLSEAERWRAFNDSGKVFQGEYPSLHAALQAYKTVLTNREERSHFAALISEERVRRSVEKGIESYEALLDLEGEPVPGAREHFERHSKPLLLEIVNDGTWPSGTTLFDFFELSDDRGVTYDGYFLRLQVATPNTQYQGFATPIVDLYFGKTGSVPGKVDKTFIPLIIERNKYAAHFDEQHPTTKALDAELNAMKRELKR